MKLANAVLERTRAASEALAEHRRRKQLLDWCDRADARIAQEVAALVDDAKQRLTRFTSRAALPAAPRIAPHRVALPAAPEERDDPFVADLVRRFFD